MEAQISKCKILLSHFGPGQGLVTDGPRALLLMHSTMAVANKERWDIVPKNDQHPCKHDTHCLYLTISSGQISPC